MSDPERAAQQEPTAATTQQHAASMPEIRAATDADDWDLIGLIAACWGEYPGCVFDLHGEVPWLRTPATSMAERGGCLWVAEVDSRVVGVVGCQPAAEPGGLELRTLYVARNWRRIGLGARLVAQVEAEAARLGAQFVDLWSDSRFLAAHRLYERLGYRRLPETRDLHDLSNTTEVHYRKDGPFVPK